MKKLWVLILLVSLGLNLGLGLRFLQNKEYCPQVPEVMSRGKGSGKGWEPSHSDTTAWRKLAGRRLNRLASHLNLTPEQKEIFAKSRADVGKRMMIRRSEMQIARTELLGLVADESTPQETLRRSFRDLAARQGEIDSVITEVLLLELEVLDQDQRIKYLDMLPMNQRGHPGMHGRGRGQRGPD